VSDKLRKHINVELEQINRLIEDHRSLLAKCVSEEPTTIELSALAYLLHSFYLGIENIFTRIAKHFDSGLPSGEAWHRQLLDSMAIESDDRASVLSQDLYETLGEYLAFRHVFRLSYSFHLQWEKMSGLVLNCEATMRRFETEIKTFLRTTTQN
jgi:hypothetical protein